MNAVEEPSPSPSPARNAEEGDSRPLPASGTGKWSKSTLSEEDSEPVFAVGFSRLGSTEPGNLFPGDRTGTVLYESIGSAGKGG
jgi:hypothetical protein